MIEPWTQDSAWYNTLPVFEKYGVKLPSRKYFKAKIKVVCEKLGFTREQLGIVAAPWATMYYNGVWTGVGFDVVNSLATKGTDIIFIEKLDLVRVFAKYADKFGLALVNSHGHLVEYAKDLTKAAEASGAHVAIATDYDIPGVLIASEAKGVVWLGVNEKMLQYFNLDKQNKSVVVSYNPKKKRLDPEKFRNLIESDERFKGVVDMNFLKKNKIELDAILAAVGGEKLWKYLMEELKESYPTRDYNRVISSRPSLLNYYPQSIRDFILYIRNYVDLLISNERKKIEAELKDVKGLIEVEKKKKEIEKRLGDIIKADPHLKKMELELEELIKKESYDISQVPEPNDKDGSDSFGW